MNIDQKTKSLINSMFGKCDVAICCAKCGKSFAVKPVAAVIEMDEAGVKALGFSLFPVVSTHACGASK